MKNITVSVDEETHRLARIRAAELDTSVSALVRRYPQESVWLVERSRAADPSGTETAGGTEAQVTLNEVLADFDARGVGLHMADNLYPEKRIVRPRCRAGRS